MRIMKKESKVDKTAKIFKLLGDGTRCRILLILKKHPDGMYVYEIADTIGMSHSATSHQLATLERGGLVSSYKDGQTVLYTLAPGPRTQGLIKALFQIHRS